MVTQTHVEHEHAETGRRAHGPYDGVVSRSPTCRRVLDDPEVRIRSGELGPGARLLSERELTWGLGVSRATLRRALDELELAGLFRRSVGRGGGTFVSQPTVERAEERLLKESPRPSHLRL
jgi:DNA-binding GntR family transcriptional regulator